MKDDLIERLRHHRVILKSGDYDGAQLMEAWCDMINAADALEAAQKRIAELEEALKPFAVACEDCFDEEDHDAHGVWEHPVGMQLTVGDFRRAGAALTSGQGEG